MRIYFFAPFCLLRATTNRIFDVRFCDALAGQGADVELIHPFYAMKENIAEEEVGSVYGIKNKMHVRMLRTRLREDMPAFRQAFVLMAAFSWQLMKFTFHKSSGKAVLFSRDIKLLFPAMVLRKLLPGKPVLRVIIHVHEVRNDRLSRWVYRHADGIWTTTVAARDKMCKDFAIPEAKFQSIGACQAPANAMTRGEARRLIHYTDPQPLVIYTGKLGKGIVELEYILDAAALLPGVNFLFTGGKEDTLAYMQSRCSDKRLHNVRFSGFIKEVEFVRTYQAAADVLVSYYSASDHAVKYNLPQKLMEYMFSGNPVVTPDFPASRPFVNELTACIVQPDNAAALADGIRKILADPSWAKGLANRAAQAVKDRTFEKLSGTWLAALEEA